MGSKCDDLTIKRAGKIVWSSLEEESHKVAISDGYRLMQAKDNRYMCHVARLIEELPEAKPKATGVKIRC